MSKKKAAFGVVAEMYREYEDQRENGTPNSQELSAVRFAAAWSVIEALGLEEEYFNWKYTGKLKTR